MHITNASEHDGIRIARLTSADIEPLVAMTGRRSRRTLYQRFHGFVMGPPTYANWPRCTSTRSSPVEALVVSGWPPWEGRAGRCTSRRPRRGLSSVPKMMRLWTPPWPTSSGRYDAGPTRVHAHHAARMTWAASAEPRAMSTARTVPSGWRQRSCGASRSRESAPQRQPVTPSTSNRTRATSAPASLPLGRGGKGVEGLWLMQALTESAAGRLRPFDGPPATGEREDGSAGRAPREPTRLDSVAWQ
jgi:hypothetical protein